MPCPLSGYGSRVEWETSGYTCLMQRWRAGPLARHARAAAHMGTPQPGAGQWNNARFLPGRLNQGLDIILTILAAPGEMPPITQAPEMFRLVFPRQPTEPFAVRWRGMAFVTRYEVRGLLDDLVRGEITLRFGGGEAVEIGFDTDNGYTEEFEWDGIGALTTTYTEEFEWDGIGALTTTYTEEFES